VLSVTTQKWEIYEAAHAFEAISVLERLYLSGRSLDLILLDWIMPGPKGIDFLKEIRLNSQYKNIKVVMITSDGDKNHAIDAIRSGASAFLVKPITTEQLTEIITSIFPE
jgi:response regulator of citrate/malate metabolism